MFQLFVKSSSRLIIVASLSTFFVSSAILASEVKANTKKSKKYANQCVKLVSEENEYDAFGVCEKLAKQSDKVSQFFLGTLYYQGKGALKDFTLAFKWIKKSSYNNLPIAQYNLGIMIANGQGTELDLVQASAWLQLAQKNGYGAATEVIKQINKDLSAKEKEKLIKLYEQLEKEVLKN